MSATTMIQKLAADGILLSANDDKLHVVAPPGAVTAALRKTLKDAKQELLAELVLLRAWRVFDQGKPVCTIVGRPMNQREALSAAHLHWPQGTVTPCGK